MFWNHNNFCFPQDFTAGLSCLVDLPVSFNEPHDGESMAQVYTRFTKVCIVVFESDQTTSFWSRKVWIKNAYGVLWRNLGYQYFDFIMQRLCVFDFQGCGKLSNILECFEWCRWKVLGDYDRQHVVRLFISKNRFRWDSWCIRVISINV